MSDLEIARDDIALSAIAHGNAPDSDDPALLLLASYRADLDRAAAPVTVPSERVAPTPPAAPVVPLRKRRPGTLIALSAAAGIVVGGLTAGAVVVADRPGDSLYAVHAAVFGPTRTQTDEVTSLLDQASGMLARGNRPAARLLLGRAATLIPGTPQSDQPALRRRLDELSLYAAEPARPAPRPTATPRAPRPTQTAETPKAPEPSESDDSSGSGRDDDRDDKVDNSGPGSVNSGRDR